MMKRLCAAFFAVMIVSVSTCAFMGNAAAPTDDVPTVDETTETTVDETVDAESGTETTETDESALDVVSAFVGQLQERYGEDYQACYDAIIERWGSVEVYLLSLAEDGTVPDVAKERYEKFIGFLSETAPIWGSALAIICVVLIIVFGRKWLDVSSKKWKSIFAEMNKQSEALKAQNDALCKLLGDNARFEEERKNLDETKENLSK